MSTLERLRLMTKVARLYYEHHLRQPEIARQLSLSQAMVSRLLSAAEKEGIVRTTVMVPTGIYSQLEEQLVARYKLRDAVVADCPTDSDSEVLRAVGSAAAGYLEATLGPDEIIGISSWSETLLRTVASMQPRRRPGKSHVVQILGGIGAPTAEVHAIRLTQQLASLLGAEPHFLTAPGVAASPAAAMAYLSEPNVQQTMEYFGQITVALVGIGALYPSRLLGESGNVFSQEELDALQRLGAVGDICVHFFDGQGRDVTSALNDRVVGMSLDQLRRVPRTIGIAGTQQKWEAIRGALEGRLVTSLVTDRSTAELLLNDPGPARVERRSHAKRPKA
ncbi:MAG TPA: sugar-binding transcriptional regulator [Acidimicrobiales bacterium]|nr:sugar-binding transcriptional regulator [Acidimicrobiales bacterium]